MFIPVLITVLLVIIALLAWKTWRLSRAEYDRSEARIEALAASLDNAGSDHLLMASAQSPSNRAPAFAAAAGLLVIVAILAVVALRTTGHRDAPAVSQTLSSLQLMSMRHVIDGDTLIVSGLVRNASSAPSPALTAVVSAIGRDGQVAARGESRLDPLVLEPGRETSFRVIVTAAGDLGRYRLGFASKGQVVPHVDRRADLARTALRSDARGH